MIPVILSGGNGTRLWPQSRKGYPKQFLPLIGKDTLFQSTLKRLPAHLSDPIIVCNQEHRFLVADQLAPFAQQQATIYLEPFGRNTAPAIAIAAMQAIKEDKDAVLLVLPADHHIANIDIFHQALLDAEDLATQQQLVLFGVPPTHPETGYGYIRIGNQQQLGGFKVREFVEKPDLETAAHYLADKSYVWNSGMFALHARTYLNELHRHRVDIFVVCQEATDKLKQESKDCWRIPAEYFRHCPSESVDYAVMEKTTRAIVLPLNCGWSDVGTWSSLCDAHQKDTDNNVLLGDVLAHDSSDCFVYGNNKLVTLVGVNNLIVAETDDALLVADRNKVQDVKIIVDRLNQAHRPETLLHRKVARPWGTYDSVDNGQRFQVKRIKVNPGARLSLQKHHHRAEHWIVVQGTALVTCDDKQFLLSENQSTYIPIGSVHRLENPGKVTLELIEVQSGCYLGEDDIVRLQDSYGRTGPTAITQPIPIVDSDKRESEKREAAQAI
jgi:mannose-1-phosphate guanylyltransferase/mannose-6-phosphate isomerase